MTTAAPTSTIKAAHQLLRKAGGGGSRELRHTAAQLRQTGLATLAAPATSDASARWLESDLVWYGGRGVNAYTVH